MEGLELISFKIIASVGMAKSLYFEAIKDAKNNDFASAQNKLKEGFDIFNEAHKIHAQLIAQEADEERENININLILMHAEDQLITSDLMYNIANEMVEMYKVIYSLK